MRNEALITGPPQRVANMGGLFGNVLSVPRQVVIGIILIMALFAFEIFNFDTTRYALRNLLGDVRFIGLGWATILAVAFCAIDFAGLARMFTPQRGRDEPKEVWYLMGAWLLGATMNALMTWWAVSLTLLDHQLGNEVLSRDQLLTIVPIFVAALVWLTRILFIGAVTVAGERFLTLRSAAGDAAGSVSNPVNVVKKRPPSPVNAGTRKVSLDRDKPIDLAAPHRGGKQAGSGRVLQRPPRPLRNGARRAATSQLRGRQAASKRS